VLVMMVGLEIRDARRDPCSPRGASGLGTDDPSGCYTSLSNNENDISTSPVMHRKLKH